MTNEQADQTIPTPQMLWSLADQSYPFGSPWNVQQFQQDLQNSNSRYLFRYGKTNQELIGFLCFQQVLDEAELF
ncbi:ribosomal-protein-alanine N-acetyltransferase, partial [Listeria monocytogenes]|nr:ribosomal-protein-alanine N-acetyltransferase [Listeria monocytogenes]